MPNEPERAFGLTSTEWVVIGSMFAGIPTLIVSLVTLILNFKIRMRQMDMQSHAESAKVDADEHATEMTTKMNAIEHQTNSLVTKLADANKAQGTAEGMAIGLQQGRDEKP